MEDVNRGDVNLKKKKAEEGWDRATGMSDKKKFKLPNSPQEGADDVTLKWPQRAQQILKHTVYMWQLMNYGHKSLVYLIGRPTVEYAVIMKIFQVIVSSKSFPVILSF